MYTVLYERRVFKDLDKVHDRDLVRIDKNIQLLKQNPVPPGAKKLVGERNLYRLRQGDYRIIYTADHKAREVRILAVSHRKEACRK